RRPHRNYTSNRVLRIPFRNAARIVLALGAIGLIVWLVADSGRSARRRRKIDELLAQHLIGNVSSDVRERLEKTLPWLAAAAGIRDPVVLDQPFGRPGVLHVFITTGDFAGDTGCRTGNAVY